MVNIEVLTEEDDDKAFDILLNYRSSFRCFRSRTYLIEDEVAKEILADLKREGVKFKVLEK